MSTTARIESPRRAPRLLPAGTRLASAGLALALAGSSWLAAVQAAETTGPVAAAGQGAAAAPAPRYVTLAPVTVVAHREVHTLAAVACRPGRDATL